MTGSPTGPHRFVHATDGLGLAVHESGDPANPTVVAVHGYPDDHTIWDPVVALLADRFHVVTYDVRGAGASEVPADRAGYRLPQLVEDLAAVADATAPGEKVHLLAHDWGSIQAWAAVTDEARASRFASLTSVSGPGLDMASAWLRRTDRAAALRQLRDSWYIGLFRLPLLPEAMIRAGVLDRALAGTLRAPRHPRPRPDAVHGLELYRANMLTPSARREPRRTSVPAQVVAPRHDPHVTVRLQCEAPVPYAEHLRTHVVDGGHWFYRRTPEVLADLVADLVTEVG